MDKTLRFDDLDQTEGAERLRFAVDDRAWTIDLSPANREHFDKALEPFIAAATPVGRGSQPRAKKTTASASSSSPSAIRTWATAQGMQIARKGKVPRDIVEQYQASQLKPTAALP